MKIKLFLFILFSGIAYSQNNYFELKTLKESEILAIEKNYRSKEYKESEKHVYSNKEKKLAKAISYVRNETDDFPEAIVHYLYSEKDSIVKSTTFYWKLNSDEKRNQSSKVKEYNVAFDHLIKSMSKILGRPNPNQGNLTEVASPVENDKTINYERKVIWNTNSKTITALIVWAENHGQQMITTIE